VTTGRRLVDLPDRDPGLPRVAAVVALLSAVGAVRLLAGPAQWMPVDAPGPAAGGTPAAQRDGRIGPGASLFLAEGCGSCHTTTGSASALGPSLAGAYDLAARRVADPAYDGTDTSPEGYLRASVLDHCTWVVPGWDCTEAPTVGLWLSSDEVDQIVDFLAGIPPAGGS
jgi:hypothetical protein